VLTDDAEDQDLDGCWTEGLDVEETVILELFGIDHLGDGSLTREQLYSPAGHESISCPTATDAPIRDSS